MFDRTYKRHKAGRIAEAKIGYRQVLDVEPDHRKALYGLAQLLAADGDHRAATKTFRTFVALEPEAYKAWLKLGDSLVAQRKFADAVEAYREVVKRQPEFIIYRKLGDALVRLARVEEAVTKMAADEPRAAGDEYAGHGNRSIKSQCAVRDIRAAISFGR